MSRTCCAQERAGIRAEHAAVGRSSERAGHQAQDASDRFDGVSRSAVGVGFAGRSAARVAAVIERDLSMTAKLLQLANSTFFGSAEQVSTCRHAVELLGLDTVRGLILSMEVFFRFERDGQCWYDVDALTRHSARVSRCAHAIAPDHGASPQMLSEVATAGMLHDVGKLVLADALGMSTTALRERFGGNLAIWQIEQEAFGASHAEVGAYLLGLWGLPATVIAATAWHHRPSESGTREFSAITAVHAADVIAHRIERRANPDRPSSRLTRTLEASRSSTYCLDGCSSAAARSAMPEKILFVDDEPAIPVGVHAAAPLRLAQGRVPDDPGVHRRDRARRADRARSHPGARTVRRDRLRPANAGHGRRALPRKRAVALASARIMLTGQGDIATVDRWCESRRPLPLPHETVRHRDTRCGAGRRLEPIPSRHGRAAGARPDARRQRQGADRSPFLVNPSASSRALRVRRIVSHMVQRLHLRDPWQLELASLLSQIGYLTLGMEPAPQTGDVESFEARRQQMMHPAAARDLLANIPRLERVAAMVGGQRDPYDAEDAGLPIGQRDPVKVGAQILRVAIEFDAGMCAGLSPADALSRLRLRPGQ